MYIYLGIYYHSRHKGTLCVVDENGEYLTLEKKIGKTIDLASRENSLNRTKSPIGYTMIRAWQTGEQTDQIELAIHDLLDNVRSEGEWFNDDDDSLSDRLGSFMNRMGYPEVKFSDDTEDLVEKIDKTPGVPAATIEEHRTLKTKYPSLFTNGGKDFVSNNNNDINVYLSKKKKSFNISVNSPDYKNSPCSGNAEFQKKLNDLAGEFGLSPVFNAKSGYVKVEEEDMAIKVFERLLKEVTEGKMKI